MTKIHWIERRNGAVLEGTSEKWFIRAIRKSHKSEYHNYYWVTMIYDKAEEKGKQLQYIDAGSARTADDVKLLAKKYITLPINAASVQLRTANE